MIVINTVSATRFSFNGVEYHKNFMPFITGDKVSIINVYDSCIILTSAPTIYSDYTVNGTIYASAAALQAALLDVIYTRNSLSGGGGGISGSVGQLAKFTSTDEVGNSILKEIGNAIHLTNAGASYASFGIVNPGTPGDPGIDNDAYIGSTINNDFLIRVNNVEALRVDTALRLKIANIQNAIVDTDKFLVSDGGVVKYRTASEMISDLGIDLSGYVPTSRTLTINGTSYDLSADRSWTIPTHDAVTLGTANGLSLSGQVLSLGLASSINAGALSASDWIIFNNKVSTSTLALYVPYTGATEMLDLGVQKLSSAGVNINGYIASGVGEVLQFKQYATVNTTSTGYSSISAIGSTLFEFTNSQGAPNNKIYRLDSSSLNNNVLRTYSLPNASGTLALTSDLSGYLPLTGGTLTGTLTFNSGAGSNPTISSSANGLELNADGSTASNRNILLKIAGSTALGIDNNSNVAIGYTTNPSLYKLDVDGTGRFSGNVSIQNTNSLAPLNILTKVVSGIWTGLRIYDGVGGNFWWDIGSVQSSSQADLLITPNGGTTALSIRSSGAATFSSSVTVTNLYSTGGSNFATSGGNVGIGTASPDSKLYIKQTVSEIPFVIDSSNTSNPSYTQYRVNNSSGWEHGMAGVGDSYKYLFSYGTFSAANSKMAITSGGNVLIGTTTVSGAHLLQVNGSVLATAYFESSSISGKNILTTNPITQLNLDVIKYTRKSDENKDVRYGYSAEQVHSLMPELTDKDVASVKYLDVHTVLIQQLTNRIKELESRLN